MAVGIRFGGCLLGFRHLLDSSPELVKDTRLGARYLVWVLNNPSTQKRISLLLTGTTIKALTKATLLSLEIEVPPMAKQRQIAELDQTAQEIVAIRHRLNEIDRTETAYVTRQALHGGAEDA